MRNTYLIFFKKKRGTPICKVNKESLNFSRNLSTFFLNLRNLSTFPLWHKVNKSTPKLTNLHHLSNLNTFFGLSFAHFSRLEYSTSLPSLTRDSIIEFNQCLNFILDPGIPIELC